MTHEYWPDELHDSETLWCSLEGKQTIQDATKQTRGTRQQQTAKYTPISYTSVLDTNLHMPVPSADMKAIAASIKQFDEASDSCKGLSELDALSGRVVNAFTGGSMAGEALTEMLGVRMDRVYNTKIASVRLGRLSEQLAKNRELQTQSYSKDSDRVLKEEEADIERQMKAQTARINYYAQRK